MNADCEKKQQEEEDPIAGDGGGSADSEILDTGTTGDDGNGDGVGNYDDYDGDDYDGEEDENDHGHFRINKHNNDNTGNDANDERLPSQQHRRPISTSLRTNDTDGNQPPSLNLNSQTRSTTDDDQHDFSTQDDNVHEAKNGDQRKEQENTKNDDGYHHHEQHGDGENEQVQHQEQDGGNGSGEGQDEDVERDIRPISIPDSSRSLINDDGGKSREHGDSSRSIELTEENFGLSITHPSDAGESSNSPPAKELLIEDEEHLDTDQASRTLRAAASAAAAAAAAAEVATENRTTSVKSHSDDEYDDDDDKPTDAIVIEDETPIVESSSLHDDDEMMMMIIESQLQKYVEEIIDDENNNNNDDDDDDDDDTGGILDPQDIPLEHVSKNLHVSEEGKQPDDDANNADGTTTTDENKKIRSKSDNIGESTTTFASASASADAATDNDNGGDEMSSISSRSVVALRRRKQQQQQQHRFSSSFGNNDSDLDLNLDLDLDLDDDGDGDDDVNDDDDDDDDDEDDDIDDDSDEYGNENGYDDYDYDDADLDFDDDDLVRMRRHRRLRRADDDFDTSSTLEGMILSIPVVVSSAYSPAHGDRGASHLIQNEQCIATDILPPFTTEEGELDVVPTFEDFTSGEIAWEEAWREAERMKETLCQTVGDAHSLHREPGTFAVAHVDASHPSDQNSEISKVDSEKSPIFLSPENGAKTFLPVPFQTDFMRGVQVPFINDNDTDTSYSMAGEQSLTVTSEDHRVGTEVYEIGRIFEPSPLFVTNIEQIAPLIDRSDLGRKRSKKTKRKKGLSSDINNLSLTDTGVQSFDIPLFEDAHNMSQLSIGSNSDSSDPTKRVPKNKAIPLAGTNSSFINGNGATPSSDDDCSVFSEDSRDSIADLVVKRSIRKKKKKGNTKKQRKKMRPKKRGRKADFQSLDAADHCDAEASTSLLIDDRIDAIFNNREMLYAEIDRRQAIWKAILKLNEEAQPDKKKSTFVRSKAYHNTRQSRAKSRSPSRTGRSTRSLSQSRQETPSNPPRRSRSKSRDRSRSRSKSNDSHAPSKGASALSIKRGKKQVSISTATDTRSKGKYVNENSPKHVLKSSKSTSSSSQFPVNSNLCAKAETISQEGTNLALHPKPLKKNKSTRRKESISESEYSPSIEGKSASVDDLNEPKISLATSTNGKEQSKEDESTESPRSAGKTKTHELRRQALREKLEASSPWGKINGVNNRKIKSLTSSPESSKGKSGKLEAAGIKNSMKNLSNNLIDFLPKKKPKQGSQKEKKAAVAETDSEKAKLHSAENKVSGAQTDNEKGKLRSAENMNSTCVTDNKKTKLSSPIMRATKSSRLGNEKKKQRVLPSTNSTSDVVPGTQKGKCAVLHSQIQETSERLEDIKSNTQLDILMMKQDVERRRSTLIGQIEEMKSNPLEATKFLNSSRVASLHSEGRELRRDIRRLERGMSQTVSETQRLSLESQSINEQSQAVLADIARMEQENARHVTELEKLRAEHDKVTSSSSLHSIGGVDVDSKSSSSGSDDRSHDDHNTFLANMVPSLRDKPYIELGKQLRPAQTNKHGKKKLRTKVI